MQFTLTDLAKMIDSAGYAEPMEFRGDTNTIRALAKLCAAQTSGPQEFTVLTEVYGFPVVVDDRCPPGMLYFWRRPAVSKG